jgi:hypothetical protein
MRGPSTAAHKKEKQKWKRKKDERACDLYRDHAENPSVRGGDCTSMWSFFSRLNRTRVPFKLLPWGNAIRGCIGLLVVFFFFSLFFIFFG